MRTVTYYPAAGAMRINSTLYYTLKDQLGSASVVTDASGTILGENRYYPFGETRLTTGTIFTDKLFTGQREMAGLGIYHYDARFYSPKLGRFLSADTITPNPANPQNLNRMSYVANNPLRYIDPTGHMLTEGDGGGGVGGCGTSGQPSCGGGGGGGNGGRDGCRRNDPDCRGDDDIPVSPVDDLNLLERLLADQYTPVAFGSVQMFAAWGQDIGLALAGFGATHMDPVMGTVGGVMWVGSYMVGRVAGLISTTATFYQYKHNLYGTNGTDVIVSSVTTVAAYYQPLSSASSEINVLYSAYRLHNPAPIDIPNIISP